MTDMIAGNIDLTLVDWSRAQFALTAMYHWLFVPLTLGLSFILAVMESVYVRTGSEEWKRITRFWMTLFGINFAIGVATGLILEFEFGTNWSNYSWFVGDIFGTPLAVEGIVAFFLESTFIAVMFFGWDKVSRRFHLISTWLVAFGANLSALWILVANGWMQNPVGMSFNPETVRNEMVDFWAILFNQVAIDKFLHTISSGFLLASMFVTGISSWFLLKKREALLAKKSILVAGVFGLLSSLLVVYTGDGSARTIAEVQPVKLAAMEALYEGRDNAGLVAFGVLKEGETRSEDIEVKEISYKIEIPSLLSVLAAGSKDGYVAGINDYLYGNEKEGIFSVDEKITLGNIANSVLSDYRKAKEDKDTLLMSNIEATISDRSFQEKVFRYFGYSSIEKPGDIIPNVSILFYSFHLMVLLGFLFIVVFAIALYLLFKGSLEGNRWFLWIALFSIPLPYIASELGWIVAEMGRQPWIIQDMMPVAKGVSQIDTGSVLTTFIIFAVLFTGLLISEISIMVRQIKAGPKH